MYEMYVILHTNYFCNLCTSSLLCCLFLNQASSSSICLAPKLYEAIYIVNIIDDQPQVAHSFPLKVRFFFKFVIKI